MSRKPNRQMRQVATSITAETFRRLQAKDPGKPVYQLVREAIEAWTGSGEPIEGTQVWQEHER